MSPGQNFTPNLKNLMSNSNLTHSKPKLIISYPNLFSYCSLSQTIASPNYLYTRDQLVILPLYSLLLPSLINTDPILMVLHLKYFSILSIPNSCNQFLAGLPTSNFDPIQLSTQPPELGF